jgi:hypothetical protein
MLESPAGARPGNARIPLHGLAAVFRARTHEARPGNPAARGTFPAASPGLRLASVSCTCNVVREIPNVDNFRPLWTAPQARSFFCAQPVDGIIPGSRVLAAYST